MSYITNGERTPSDEEPARAGDETAEENAGARSESDAGSSDDITIIVEAQTNGHPRPRAEDGSPGGPPPSTSAEPDEDDTAVEAGGAPYENGETNGEVNGEGSDADGDDTAATITEDSPPASTQQTPPREVASKLGTYYLAMQVHFLTWKSSAPPRPPIPQTNGAHSRLAALAREMNERGEDWSARIHRVGAF